jgi:hypothetical protein
MIRFCLWSLMMRHHVTDGSGQRISYVAPFPLFGLTTTRAEQTPLASEPSYRL